MPSTVTSTGAAQVTPGSGKSREKTRNAAIINKFWAKSGGAYIRNERRKKNINDGEYELQSNEAK